MNNVFPTCAQGGGGMGPHIKKTTSQWNFVLNTTLHIYTLERTIFKYKIKKKDLPFQNDGQILDFCFPSESVDDILETFLWHIQ